uniref:Uncharacterized protein n=1 Tax=Eucampia antarctica TaxID=49252 RepID=A0A7S2WM52_9STRA
MGETKIKMEMGTAEAKGGSLSITREWLQKTPKKTQGSKAAKFVGLCPVLVEYMYECSGPGQAERYTKTRERINEYIRIAFKIGPYIRTALDILAPYTINQVSRGPRE